MEWVQSHPAIATAVIAVAGAVLGGLVAAAARFVFDFYLSEKIKRRWQTIEIKRRYAAQIIRAADDVSGRLGNLSRHLQDGLATEWLRPIDKNKELHNVPFSRYYFSSTTYLMAKLITWIEILKREQIFLDFASVDETRKFNSYLEFIYCILSFASLTEGGSERSPNNHWIYYHYLGGIGESCFVPGSAGAGLRCMTFHEFCDGYKSEQGNFRSWIEEVEKIFINLSSESDPRWERLQMLRLCLDRFLDFADPKSLSTTRNRMQPSDIPKHISSAMTRHAKYYGLKI